MTGNDQVRPRTVGQCEVAIIGGGFSGSILAVQLLRQIQQISIIIIEDSPSLGRGVAYSTTCTDHLLNVRAEKMSAFPDRPAHFVNWLKRNVEPTCSPQQFVSRSLFGDYIESLLQNTVRAQPSQFGWLRDRAVGIRQENGINVVMLASGTQVSARFVILATGNCSPSSPPELGSLRQPSHLRAAWRAKTFENASLLNSVLLLGTGLTAIDQVLALRAQGFRGNFFMLSRRGLLSRPHGEPGHFQGAWNGDLPRTVRGLVSLVRTQIRTARRHGHGWQQVLDSLRPASERIWSSLNDKERRRFLRHVKPFWEVHRHRVTPDAGRIIHCLLDSGELQVFAGRLRSYGEKGAPEVCFQERGSGRERVLRIDRVINCTGSQSGHNLFKTPLLNSMTAQGIARPHALMLGLDVAENGAVIDSRGEISRFCYTIGPLRRGRIWETTGVPEISCQAESLAKNIAIQLRGLESTGCEQSEVVSRLRQLHSPDVQCSPMDGEVAPRLPEPR